MFSLHHYDMFNYNNAAEDQKAAILYNFILVCSYLLLSLMYPKCELSVKRFTAREKCSR